MNVLFTKIFTTITSIVLAGEALALAVGMHFLSKKPNPWVIFKNDLFLLLDLSCSLGLFMGVGFGEMPVRPMWLAFFALLAAATHGYRFWEYVKGMEKCFCHNLALLVVNNVKLAAVVGILAITFVNL